MSEQSSEQRWVLWRDRKMDASMGPWYVGDVYGEEGDYDPMLSDPHCAERVEAMPVFEAEEAMKDRDRHWADLGDLRAAADAVIEEYERWANSPGMKDRGGLIGTCERLRAALEGSR